MRIAAGRSVLCAMFFVSAMTFGAGKALALRVSPGAFTAQNAQPGENKDTGIDLTITNDTDKEREFSLKVIPAPLARSESLKGYAPLPEPGWLRLEKKNLIVAPKSQGRSRIFINIPADEKYYNQHWAVSCLVEYVGQKGLFQEAILTRYMFETRPKADVTQRPYGSLGVAPSVVKVTAADQKAGRKSGFRIYNNTAQPHVYAIKTFIPKQETGKLEINPTPGLSWARKASWVRPLNGKIKVEAGGNADVQLNVEVPRKAITPEKGVEAMIFIEPDQGERRFVRIQVE